MKVSDEAVAKAKAGLYIGREKRRAIQKMDGNELTSYLVEVYRQGFEDGATALAEQEGISDGRADWETVLGWIGEVKGVGERTLERIDEHVRRRYEEK